MFITNCKIPWITKHKAMISVTSIVVMLLVFRLYEVVFLEVKVFEEKKEASKQRQRSKGRLHLKTQSLQDIIDNQNGYFSSDVHAQEIDTNEAARNSQLSAKISVSFRDALVPEEEAKGPLLDVETYKLYPRAVKNFPDKDVWQELRRYSTPFYTHRKLKIYVIPFSHLDPGWGTTYMDYFRERVKNIYDRMNDMLYEHKDMTYVIAEVSFLQTWWASATEDQRKKFKDNLKHGNLEIVGGGWVVPDEASPHFYSLIDQFIEGHQWLWRTLGVHPEYYWSIDPFGFSATMPYLLNRASIKASFISRIHYGLKKIMAERKSFVFSWNQLWDKRMENWILSYINPFTSYAARDTCGPTVEICETFDYTCSSCYTRTSTIALSQTNIEQWSYRLLEQYRSVAELTGQNVLLIPLGNDFAFQKDDEWNTTYKTYSMLFNYMNGRPGWDVEASFGTTKDYFTALLKDFEKDKKNLPTLGGDFFVYADDYWSYWSGYFSSDMALKRMDRIVMNHLRGAEIAYTYARFRASRNASVLTALNSIYNKVVPARRNLALFQHHDAITGTSNVYTRQDFRNRLDEALHFSEGVIHKSVRALLGLPMKEEVQVSASAQATGNNVEITVGFETVLINETTKQLIVFNSLPYKRKAVSCFLSANLRNVFLDGKLVPSQVNPILMKENGTLNIAPHGYKICIEVTIGPLAINRYRLVMVNKLRSGSSFATLTQKRLSALSSRMFKITELRGTSFTLRNNRLTSFFSAETGLLQGLASTATGRKHSISVDFPVYRGGSNLNGKYILSNKNDYLENGSANKILIVEGPLVKLLYVVHPQGVLLVQLDVSDSEALYVANNLDDYSAGNGRFSTTLPPDQSSCDSDRVMRVSSDIQPLENSFYTDLNGFQMIKRIYNKSLPHPANVYPISTAGFVQDNSFRLNIFSGQASGFTSKNTGDLEVFLDRSSCHDDSRGIGESLQSSSWMTTVFKLMPEAIEGVKDNTYHDSLSLQGHHESLSLQHPLFIIADEDDFNGGASSISLVHSAIPCNFHMLNLRTLTAEEKAINTLITHSKPGDAALIINRLEFSQHSRTTSSYQGCNTASEKISLKDLLPEGTQNVVETTLTLMHEKGHVQNTDAVPFLPMELKTFKLKYS
uniref:Alpha-mannosidase n=1 Tax=Trichuris muris TaxID=70415 RepID=A0A5S6QJ19_TRIMR